MKSSWFSKIAGFFPATYSKIYSMASTFQGFYLDFNQFSIVCNIPRRLFNGRFRNFQNILLVTKQSFNWINMMTLGKKLSTERFSDVPDDLKRSFSTWKSHATTQIWLFFKKKVFISSRSEIRAVSRAPAIIKDGELYIDNQFQPLTIITKSSILDVVAVLDPPLIINNF